MPLMHENRPRLFFLLQAVIHTWKVLEPQGGLATENFIESLSHPKKLHGCKNCLQGQKTAVK